MVLDFWFTATPRELWFARDAGFDAAVAARFGALHAALARSVPPEWWTGARARLATIIVLDQFSRNLYRDDPRAFAQDAAARLMTRMAIAAGDEAVLDDDQRQFLYMPLMHSEAIADQHACVARFAALGQPEPLAFAEEHRAVVAAFGRFPARNTALGRASTPAELSFLAAT